MTITLQSLFAITDHVHIDNDTSMTAVVIALTFRAEYVDPLVEVSWLHAGILHTAWVNEWRLTSAGRA